MLWATVPSGFGKAEELSKRKKALEAVVMQETPTEKGKKKIIQKEKTVRELLKPKAKNYVSYLNQLHFC